MIDPFRKEYRDASEEEIKDLSDIKQKAQELYDHLGSIESRGRAGREIALAKTKLEECVSWAEKALSA